MFIIWCLAVVLLDNWIEFEQCNKEQTVLTVVFDTTYIWSQVNATCFQMVDKSNFTIVERTEEQCKQKE